MIELMSPLRSLLASEGVAASLTEATPAVAAAIPRPRGWVLAFVLMLFGTVSTLAYWSIWFLVDRSLIANANTDTYYAFENAFPLADLFMAASSLAGAVALFRRHPTALLWMLLAGSSSIYLGLMDVLFDLQNGIYAAHTGMRLVIEIAINVLAFAIPIYGIAFAWRARFRLLGCEARP